MTKMRIACLQFSPQVGDVDNNLNRADAVLSKANPQNLDLLVLPELAFSGYNFRSLQHISPFLEPTTAGITSLWARTTALKYDCVVSVGYPEKVDVTPKWPASPEYYNSAVVVNGDGETIANYRKSFLYYADETWALEGPDGFFDGDIHGLGKVAMGICMDLNPYRFEAPWAAWEFGYHILHKEANLVILSMAWLTREDARSFSRSPKDPDMDTLSYWLARLEPLIRAETEGEIIVVIANRTGTEDEAVYAGTSAVLGIHAGEVKLYGILGRGEKELLVVDTCTRPQAKLIADVDMSPVMSPAMSPAMSPTVSLGLGRQKSEDSSNRTKSVSSEESVLSIVTQATADTSPSSINHAMTIDGMATPVSPVHPTSPGLFFAPKGPAPEDRLAGGLTSSIGIELQGFNDALPNSPCAPRPASPKSRNASRTRHRKEHNVNLTSHNLPAGQLNQTAFDVTLPMSPASAVFDWHSTIDLFQPSVTPLNLGLWSGRTLTRRRSTLW